MISGPDWSVDRQRRSRDPEDSVCAFFSLVTPSLQIPGEQCGDVLVQRRLSQLAEGLVHLLSKRLHRYRLGPTMKNSYRDKELVAFHVSTREGI